jgi:hypothetical protein
MRTSRPILVLLALTLIAAEAPRPVRAQVMGHGPTMMKMPSVQIHLASDTVVVPTRIRDGRIVVDVMLDGKGPFPFVFDSGAHGSVMDLEFARAQGIALGPQVMVGSPGGAGRPGQLATIGKLELGGLSLGGMTVVAFTGLPFKDSNPPRGVLGPYGLAGLLITLDYPHSRLVFARGALPEPDGREIFGWSADQPLPQVPISLAGQKVDVHLDTGARYGISLPLSFEKTLPLVAPPVDAGRARTVDQDVAAQRATLKGTMTLGRYTLENPTLMFSSLHQDVGNIGPPLLKQFTFTLDPANRRLRLEGPADGKLLDAEPAPQPKP